jgi:hypothetical protein
VTGDIHVDAPSLVSLIKWIQQVHVPNDSSNTVSPKDIQVALMNNRYTRHRKREEVVKPTTWPLIPGINHKRHEAVSPASCPIEQSCQVNVINLPCEQPASWNISTACRACSVHF